MGSAPSLAARLLSILEEPEVRNVDVDSPQRLIANLAVLRRKPMLRHVFEDFHRTMRQLDERYFEGADGLRLELGAGVYPMKHLYPDVVSTDVLPGPNQDRCLNAEAMDLPDCSVRAFYAQNSFHHFPHPERFFMELVRVLQPRGGAILIEPANGPFASLLYAHFFYYEGFDKSARSWDLDMSGPMGGANQAQSHVVFVRDRQRFEARFPELEIVRILPLSNWVRHLVSGGVNFRPLLPQWSEFLLRGLEWLLAPFARILALHHAIVLRRKAG